MSSALALPLVPATSLSPAAVVAATLGAAIVIGVLVVLMRRHADAFPLLAVLALPFRLPISADGRTVNLLVPLYLVVGAGVLAHLLPRLLEREERGLDTLEWLLLASIVLYAVQALYSSDLAKAAENVGFFYAPFALLFVLLRDVRWTPQLLLRCLGVAVALAVIFAGIGFVEYARKELFLNPKVVAADQFDNYFRVNSLFFDPNVYGRFLALVMIAVTAVVLWWRNLRGVLAAAALLAWLLAGLVTSFSQSSIAALLLGLAVLAAYRWSARRTIYVSLAVVVLAVLVVVLAPKSWHFGASGIGGSANNATTGRAKLIEGGLELFADRPVQGFGSGSFQKQYERHSKASVENATSASLQKQYERHSKASVENATSASHTIPVTVAAEQGIVGLALYVALLVLAFVVLFRGAGRSPPRIAIAACFAALVLHTFAYADFLEDPLTWTLLGIGAALARAGASAGRESAAGARGEGDDGPGARAAAA